MTEKCYSCGGKGTYSQMHGIYGAEDFCKRDGFTEKPSIHNYQCNSCEGTGLKKVMTQDWKETINERLDSAIKYNWEGGFERKFFVGYVELLLKEQRNAEMFDLKEKEIAVERIVAVKSYRQELRKMVEGKSKSCTDECMSQFYDHDCCNCGAREYNQCKDDLLTIISE